MKSRLSRPLLAAVVSGAFLVGGGFLAAPAFAEPPPPGAPESTITPTTEPASTEPTTPAPTDLPTTTPPVTETTTAPPATTEPPVETTEPPTTTPPVTTPPPTTTTPPPPVDKTAPLGTFTPNRWSIFPGQSVTLTLTGIKDNVSTAAQIKRVVTWGDGSSSTVSTTAKTVAHTYKSSGKKPITLTLTDAAGNKKVVTSKGPTVVPSSVKYKVSRTSVFHGQKFVWELLSVPAGATKITIAWGDGRATVLTKPKKQKITRHYFATPDNRYVVAPGVKTIKVTAYNKYGAATPQVAGKITLKNDTARPTAKITPPSNAGKAKSWKSIKGTVRDTGSGVKEVVIGAFVGKSNGTVVCYAPKKKKWVTFGENFGLCLISATASKGKFSAALKVAPPKGYLSIGVSVMDWAGNVNAENNGLYDRRIS